MPHQITHEGNELEVWSTGSQYHESQVFGWRQFRCTSDECDLNYKPYLPHFVCRHMKNLFDKQADAVPLPLEGMKVNSIMAPLAFYSDYKSALNAAFESIFFAIRFDDYDHGVYPPFLGDLWMGCLRKESSVSYPISFEWMIKGISFGTPNDLSVKRVRQIGIAELVSRYPLRGTTCQNKLHSITGSKIFNNGASRYASDKLTISMLENVAWIEMRGVCRACYASETESSRASSPIGLADFY